MAGGNLTSKMHVFGAASLNRTLNGSGTNHHQWVQLVYGRGNLQSIKVSNNGTVAHTLDFYDMGETITKNAGGQTIRTNGVTDNGTTITATLGKLVHRVHVGAARENLDFDFHGAMLEKGLFCLCYGAAADDAKTDISVSAQHN